MKLKKSNEKFLIELKELNPSITSLEEYKGANVKISVQCNICGHIWNAAPHKLLSGRKCPECKKAKIRQSHLKTNEYFLAQLKEINSEIKPLESYKGMNEDIKCICTICGTEFNQKPRHTLRGHGCPNCRYIKTANSQVLTQEEFIQRLQNVHKDNIIPLEDYYRYNVKMKFKCNVCGTIFERLPNEILSGYGCNHCHKSKGELFISNYLDNNSITYVPQKKFADCKNIKPLPFDFYLPDLNMCIEYDGEQHSNIEVYQHITNLTGNKLKEEFNKMQSRDLIKTNYCLNNNITLIRITDKTQQQIFNTLDIYIKKGGDENEQN